VKHFHTNREPCEVMSVYFSLGCRPGGSWANTWQWTKRFTIFFSNRSNSSLSYYQIFFL